MASPFLDALEPFLEPVFRLPLGASGGRDNIVKDAAVALAVAMRIGDGEAARTLGDGILHFMLASAVPGHPGLLYREPGNTTSNSVDNLVGAVAASALLHTSYAEDALEHGHTHGWTFSVQHPDASFRLWNPATWYVRQDWYGRFVGLAPFLWLANGFDIEQAEMFLFTRSCAFTVKSERGNTSDKILLWLQLEVIADDPIQLAAIKNAFATQMRKLYPGGLAELLGIYYGETHPFSTFAPRSWFA